MQEQKTIPLHIAKEQEGSYFTLPVEVPAHVERLDIAYEYPRYEEVSREGWTERREVCVVDLAVSAPGGAYVGSSGSDRSRIWICSAGSAQGYDSVPISPGTWEIIVGAYKIPAEGADVRYTVTFTRKELRLFRGDTHLHTLGSDGSMSVLDAARCAQFRGLDFIFLSDHNNFAQNFSRVSVPGVTVLPGTEWTHYKGHCGMLGVERPYRSAFCVNTREEAAAKLEEARANGAAVVLNHPFCPSCGWKMWIISKGSTTNTATRRGIAAWKAPPGSCGRFSSRRGFWAGWAAMNSRCCCTFPSPGKGWRKSCAACRRDSATLRRKAGFPAALGLFPWRKSSLRKSFTKVLTGCCTRQRSRAAAGMWWESRKGQAPPAARPDGKRGKTSCFGGFSCFCGEDVLQ